MTTMQRPLFLPTARQTNWLLIVGFLSVGQALPNHGLRPRPQVFRRMFGPETYQVALTDSASG